MDRDGGLDGGRADLMISVSSVTLVGPSSYSPRSTLRGSLMSGLESRRCMTRGIGVGDLGRIRLAKLVELLVLLETGV
jgi:hypothetical protein